jgi:hypothetical protein
VQVFHRPLAHQDIRFIKQDNGFPSSTKPKYIAQLLLEFLNIGTELARGDPVKRPLRALGNAL